MVDFDLLLLRLYLSTSELVQLIVQDLCSSLSCAVAGRQGVYFKRSHLSGHVACWAEVPEKLQIWSAQHCSLPRHDVFGMAATARLHSPSQFQGTTHPLSVWRTSAVFCCCSVYCCPTGQFKLLTPVAMQPGLRFAIREGGRTVGAGVVSKVIS